MAPLIALVTDFGSQDHYVGAVKGAILTVCPEATIVDVVHELPPQDILAGALALAASHGAFPPGTVFLAVVDPGVGSARRGLAAAAGPHLFVAPDNGILSLVLPAAPAPRVHAVTNSALWRRDVSATFHARDIFGPVAAHLARGTALDDVGPPVADPVRLTLPEVHTMGDGEWRGRVIHIDRFGNLTTNFGPDALALVLRDVGGDEAALVVTVEGTVMPIIRTYSDLPEGEVGALVGSSGWLEVAVTRGSAARVLGAPRGAAVHVKAVAVREG